MAARQEVLALHERAQRALNRRAYAEAQALCREILSREPAFGDAHFLLGMVAVAGRRIAHALECIDRALLASPDNPEYLAQRARCLALQGRNREARGAAGRALERAPRDALTLDTIGVTLSKTGDHERAVEALQRAVDARPESADFRFNLASSLQFMGRFDDAATQYETAVALRPNFHRAHWALAELVRATPEHNHLERLTRLLAQAGDDVDAGLYLGHAIAKEQEDLGLCAEAFETLRKAKATKRRTLNYSIEQDRILFDKLMEVFTPQRVAGPGCDSAEAIFVLGMPRTGTTLVERILTSHSEVFSAGELQNFALAVKRAAGTRTAKVLDAETLDAAIKADVQTLGERYIESTRPATGHTPRFVDKMPLNFFYVGFIREALPNAKVVCLRRHPLDTCLSNFRQMFALSFSYYNYAYDLLDTGRYYVMFDRLMKHWNTLFPDNVLEVEYEALVADQAGQTRRLLEFCGLPFEAACLDFQGNPAPVATASAVQVRQPLYSSAVGRWRRYAKELEPLAELLARSGVTLDPASPPSVGRLPPKRKPGQLAGL